MTPVPKDTSGQAESAPPAPPRPPQNGEAIKAIRVRSQHTQLSLATAVGRTQSWLSYVERNKKGASWGALTKIARELRVPLSAITRELEHAA